jgi:hypothetical protein
VADDRVCAAIAGYSTLQPRSVGGEDAGGDKPYHQPQREAPEC